MGRRVDARTVAGADSPEATTRPSQAWTWLGIGVAIGFGIGLLFLGPSPGGEPVGSSAELTSPVGRETDPATSPAEGDAIAAAREFRVLGVEVTDDGGLRQISGPLNGPLVEQDLHVSADSEVAIDASGTMLAIGEPSGRDRLLIAGRAPRLAPKSTGVVSFAWHDSRPGLLSYMEETAAEERALKVVGTDQEIGLIIRSDLLLRGVIAAWGDWGWAIQGPEETITILDPAGEFLESAPGLLLDSHGTGWLLTINHTGLNLVIPGGGIVLIDIDYEAIGGVGAASMSPDRKKLALIGPTGVKVTSINGEGPSLVVPLGSVPTAISWSPDSRLVVLAQSGRSVVLDTVVRGTGQVSYALEGRSLVALSTLR